MDELRARQLMIFTLLLNLIISATNLMKVVQRRIFDSEGRDSSTSWTATWSELEMPTSCRKVPVPAGHYIRKCEALAFNRSIGGRLDITSPPVD